MKKKNVIIYIALCIVLAMAALGVSSCGLDEETEIATATPDSQLVGDEPAKIPEITLAGCLFIGDSRTEGLRQAGSLTDADIFCSVGMSVFDATTRVMTTGAGAGYNLFHFLSTGSYKKVYILLGINEITRDLDEVTETYSELLSLVREYQPDAKIIIQANPHVTTWRSSSGDACNNENVDLLNSKLYALTDGESICWLDPNPLLDDENGGFRAEYAAGDGLHPNRDCCIIWGEWIVAQNPLY